jgi:L,D-peptidoglycan transpeptidase YkuD (ErfK/YbiS/YcfS/YnhG family)
MIVATAVGALLLAGCGSSGHAAASDDGASPTVPASSSTDPSAVPSTSTTAADTSSTSNPVASSQSLPGVGPAFAQRIPTSARQLVLVSGKGLRDTTSTVTLWERDGASGWKQVGGPIPAHNGAGGWSADHHEGDEKTPIGVFTLTAGGGALPDPGAKIPYEYRASYYTTSGTFLGGDLRGTFDYVVAIDYNRIPGTPPSDSRKPDGAAKGGDIWLHVDHQSPTHACVSLPLDNMRSLVRWLDPADHPVVAMGDAASLAA